MNIKDILFSKTHLTAPFTLPNHEKKRSTNFSTMEKVVCIACSIFVGAFTAGIGGAIAFYIITAAMKANKLNHARPIKIPSSILETVNKNLPEILKLKPVISPDLIRSTSYPTSIENRRIPPLSSIDTVICINGVIKSIHPENVKLYQDDEILILHPSCQQVDLGDDIKADMTQNSKIVIQQQAMRGCTAAVAAMLIYDAKKPIDINSLQSTNLGNTKSITHLIEQSGLKPIVTELNIKDSTDELLSNLQALIQNHGPAIVSTDNDIGCHVIIVDEVNADSIHLRDPYHGWSIAVTPKAFLRGFSGGNIIQIPPQ